MRVHAGPAFLQYRDLLASGSQSHDLWFFVVAQSLSHVWLFVTPWTVACQYALSMEFSRQEYWSGFTSAQFSCSVASDSLWLHGLQHARLPCPSQTPRACWNSCLSSWWCHPTISSSVVPFFSCLQSFPASGSFPMSQFFASGSQTIGASASASVLLMNIQDFL